MSPRASKATSREAHGLHAGTGTGGQLGRSSPLRGYPPTTRALDLRLGPSSLSRSALAAHGCSMADDALPDVDPVEDPSDPRDPPGFEQTTTTAVAALQHWRHPVRSLPMLGTGEHGIALRGLVAWYERVCVDERYANPPPADGLGALMLTEQERSAATAEGFLVAWWAIRVAEELVRCRQLAQEERGEAAVSVGLARLDVSLQTALERIGP